MTDIRTNETQIPAQAYVCNFGSLCAILKSVFFMLFIRHDTLTDLVGGNARISSGYH